MQWHWWEIVTYSNYVSSCLPSSSSSSSWNCLYLFLSIFNMPTAKLENQAIKWSWNMFVQTKKREGDGEKKKKIEFDGKKMTSDIVRWNGLIWYSSHSTFYKWNETKTKRNDEKNIINGKQKDTKIKREKLLNNFFN